jgi:hypothetical protein
VVPLCIDLQRWFKCGRRSAKGKPTAKGKQGEDKQGEGKQGARGNLPFFDE